MKKVVGTGLIVVMSAGMFGAPALAQSNETRRQARVERQERARHRLEERREAVRRRVGDDRLRRLESHRLRMDRNRDGLLSRSEIRRYRLALRRTLRRVLRWNR